MFSQRQGYPPNIDTRSPSHGNITSPGSTPVLPDNVFKRKMQELIDKVNSRMAQQETQFEKLSVERHSIEERKRQDLRKKSLSRIVKYQSKAGRVVLNVGGQIHETTLETLSNYSESLLGTLFSGRYSLKKASDGAFEVFLDRDGKHFRFILDFLRCGSMHAVHSDDPVFLREMLEEAEFYEVRELADALRAKLEFLGASNIQTFQPQDLSNMTALSGGGGGEGPASPGSPARPHHVDDRRATASPGSYAFPPGPDDRSVAFSGTDERRGTSSPASHPFVGNDDRRSSAYPPASDERRVASPNYYQGHPQDDRRGPTSPSFYHQDSNDRRGTIGGRFV